MPHDPLAGFRKTFILNSSEGKSNRSIRDFFEKEFARVLCCSSPPACHRGGTEDALSPTSAPKKSPSRGCTESLTCGPCSGKVLNSGREGKYDFLGPSDLNSFHSPRLSKLEHTQNHSECLCTTLFSFIRKIWRSSPDVAFTSSSFRFNCCRHALVVYFHAPCFIF